MKKHTIILIVLVSTLLLSCSTTKILRSPVLVNELSDIQRFEPISYIQIIKNSNIQTYSDSLSMVSKKIITTVLDRNKETIPITGELVVSDIFLKDTLEKEIDYLFYLSSKQKEKTLPQLTPVIDSLLEANGKRFGLISMSTGFTRAKYNYGLQIVKGILVGILTMGMYVEVPVSANSSLSIMIVDAKENNVAFFNNSYLQDEEPIDSIVINKQVQRIFNGYFWEK